MRSYDSPGVITPHPISSHGVDVTCSLKSGNYLALPFSTSESSILCIERSERT